MQVCMFLAHGSEQTTKRIHTMYMNVDLSKLRLTHYLHRCHPLSDVFD